MATEFNTNRTTLISRVKAVAAEKTVAHKLYLYTPLLITCLLLLPLTLQAGPTIQHWTTSNGARVYFIPAPDLPMVDVRVTFDAGSARDEQQPGLAQLCNNLLAAGNSKINADLIATRFAQVGARFSTSTYRDMASIEIRSLIDSKLLQPAIQTAALILAEPSFPKTSFERERQRLQVNLLERRQSPGDIANDAFMAAVYEGHPYASPVEGTKNSVASLQRRDVIHFHRRYYVSQNATIAIVGALDRKAAEQLAWTLVKNLKTGRAAPLLPPANLQISTASHTQPRVIKIFHPSSQTHILTGQTGIRRDDVDYFPLYVGNHILGGSGLVSRISKEIRGKRGLSYSAYSYFSPMRQQGPFIIGLQTRNDQSAQALEIARDTVQQFITDGPTKIELENSIKNITGGFPLRLSSNKKTLRMLAMIGFYQLPLDYLNSFTNAVYAVTTDAIKEAFKRRLQPRQMITIMVGGDLPADQDKPLSIPNPS